MSETRNVLRVETVQLAIPILQQARLAVGMELAKVQYLVQLQGDEDAPHFAKGQEPTQDGKAYQAVDGVHYYRPELRVAHREIEPKGPDVRFLKDAEGAVWLYFELEERAPAGTPKGAQPFNVRVDDVALNWTGASGPGSRVFKEPTLVMQSDSEGGGPNFTIRVGAKLEPEEVNTIHQALSDPSARASVSVKLSYGYWVDDEDSASGREAKAPARARKVAAADARASASKAASAKAAEVKAVAAVRPTLLSAVKPVLAQSVQQFQIAPIEKPGVPAAAKVAAEAAAAPVRKVLIDRAKLGGLRLADRSWAGEVLAEAEKRKQNFNFKTVSLVRNVPFHFDPSLAINRPIYAALLADETIGDTWMNTDFGWIRKASFPNTVYRLPDEVRLAYNAAMGAPYMIPALYRDAEGEPRVRVTLGATPWHDPEKLVRLRDYLHRSTAGLLAAPHVVVGGYEEARLRLTSAFPEEIRSLQGDGIEVALETGFQLTLDLSLEFYKFLCEVMTGPIGLTGEIRVKVRTSAPGDEEKTQTVERIVPVRINLSDIGSLPVKVEVDAEVVSPSEVRLVNAAGATMRIGDCVPRLLQYDPNSVVPIEVLEATAESGFPATLEPGGAIEVGLKPKGEGTDSAIWNAVLVELLGQSLIQDPKAALERIHEIAPESSLSWQIEAECPLFHQSPLPERFQNLYRVEVQISRPGFAVQQLVLGRDNPTARVTMQRSLREIVREDGPALATFTYRVRNVYYDRLGAWSEERAGEGSTIFVFPNPVEND